MKRISVHTIQETELIDAFKECGVTFDIVNRKVSPLAKTFYLSTKDSIKKIRTAAQDVAYRIGVENLIVEPDYKKRMVKLIAFEALSSPLGESFRAKYPAVDLKIPIGLGVDGPVYHDFGAVAHLLVAGTTGSGKSYLVHSLLQGILTADIPYLSIIPMDFKRTELTRYEKFLPSIFNPIRDVVDAKDTLAKLVEIMDMRYGLLGNTYKNIDEYNKATGSTLDRIFVVIDEFAEMMLTNKIIAKEIEISIVRLAQKSRAAGIHLIISTQRPSVDVVTGQIKANIEGRLSLKVVSASESRIILNMSGAENLSKGAFIYKIGHPVMGRVFATNLSVIDGLIGAKRPLIKVVEPAKNPYKAVIAKEDIEFYKQFASRNLGGLPTLTIIRAEIEKQQEITMQHLLEIAAADANVAIDDIHFAVQCAVRLLEIEGMVKCFKSIGAASVNVNSRTFREWDIYNLKYVKPVDPKIAYQPIAGPAVDPKTAELSEDTKDKVASMLRFMTLDKRAKILKRMLTKLVK